MEPRDTGWLPPRCLQLSGSSSSVQTCMVRRHPNMWAVTCHLPRSVLAETVVGSLSSGLNLLLWYETWASWLGSNNCPQNALFKWFVSKIVSKVSLLKQILRSSDCFTCSHTKVMPKTLKLHRVNGTSEIGITIFNKRLWSSAHLSCQTNEEVHWPQRKDSTW